MVAQTHAAAFEAGGVTTATVFVVTDFAGEGGVVLSAGLRPNARIATTSRTMSARPRSPTEICRLEVSHMVERTIPNLPPRRNVPALGVYSVKTARAVLTEYTQYILDRRRFAAARFGRENRRRLLTYI